MTPSQADALPIEKFKSLLKKLSGKFAINIKSRSEVFAAIDHIRSILLLYSNTRERIYISDDADWAKRRNSCSKADLLNDIVALLTNNIDRIIPLVGNN